MSALMAQEPGRATEVLGGNSTTVSEPDKSEGIMYKVPSGPAELQQQNTTAAPESGAGLQGNFLQRLGGFYKSDWTGKLPSSQAPARRALNAPLDSPPFPSSDWGYGGSSAIGVPDGNVYPLMTALKMENSRTKVYGWSREV